jgi:hypothetical protein
VRAFGEKVFDVIEVTPDRLREIETNRSRCEGIARPLRGAIGAEMTGINGAARGSSARAAARRGHE